MQGKSTRKKVRFFRYHAIALLIAILSYTGNINSQVLYSEGFTTVAPLPAGWASQNLSSPVGTSAWFQGNTAVFNAQAGAATSYIGANFNNTAGVGTISNWLFMPTVSLKDGDIFTFYTRIPTGTVFPDRLQVRMSLNGASVNAGATATSVGDFTNLLLDINPTYSNTTTAYPQAWTQFTVNITGVPTPTSGRLAFRYFVENGGPSGANSNYIGIDEVVYTSTSACSGTPAPGNTLSTVASACPGENFTLSLQNASSGNVTYQWQSSPDGIAWTNITGATASTYVTNLTAATQYRCQVTCTGNTGISNAVTVGLTPPTGCYCVPPASDCTDDDVITRVILNTLNNASTCSVGPPPGYTYFSSVPATTVFSGAANPITVQAPATWSESVGVWIDYNQNGVFETTEFTSLGNKPAGATSLTGNLIVPANATAGTTRMRVRIRFGATAFTGAQACVAATFSETEDYNVVIAPCVPVTITTAPVNRTITCGGNTTFVVATNGSVPAYSWQYRASATDVWQTVTNGGIYSGATTSTLTLTNVPDGNNGYQYRALVSGGCSAVDFSAPATLTVNRLVPVVNPASAAICNGTIQALTLTNSVSAPTTLTFTASTGLPLVVPDGDPAGILTTPVAVSGVPAGSVITNVSIRFSMTHTWAGDLVMNLKAPNGQVLNLIGLLNNGTGGNNTANFTNTVVDSVSIVPMSGAPAPRTGTFRADRFNVGAGALAAAPTTTNFWLPLLSTMNGDWQLAMSDLGAGDVGTLTGWSISVTYVAPVFAQGTWTGPAGTMFTDAAATTAYTGTPATTIYVVPTATSTYNVTFSTATCTSSSASVPVTVSNPVTGLAVTPATRSACASSNTSFTATTTGGGPVSAYQWQVSTNGGATFANITGATSATLSLANITTAMNNNQYRVIATGGPCGAVTSAAGTLVVNPLPVVTLTTPDASITPGQTATITASSTNVAAASYSWSLNGSPLTGVTGSTFVADVNQLGLYTVTATTAAGCTSAQPASIEITGEASDRLWIYPNPSSGQFQVRLFNTGDPSERRVVTVFNSSGARIIEKSFTLTNANGPYLQMDFDFTGKAAGTYVVKVEDRFSGKVTSGIVVISH